MRLAKDTEAAQVSKCCKIASFAHKKSVDFLLDKPKCHTESAIGGTNQEHRVVLDFAKHMISRFVLTFEFEALRRVQGF
jgi:hypothetical protein